MANVKISQLGSAATLTGTEALPIVQSGSTLQTTVQDIANLAGGGGVGTVTSVAALTIGTSGTDLSSTVANSTTTPVITLNVPTASAVNRGALSSADWATFNGKESVLTFSSPLVRTTNTISIPAATTSVNGYLASADFTTFNNKQNAITLTTTGSSGVSTLVGATLNIPDYGSALTGYVTLATTQTITGAKTFSGLTSFTFSSGTRMDYGPYLIKGSVPIAFSGSTTNIYSDATTNNIVIRDNLSIAKLEFNNSTQTYTFPAATGTIALTSDLSAYVTLAGNETITGVKDFNLGLTLQDGYYPVPATGYVGLASNGAGITILLKSGLTVYNNNFQFPNASNDYNFPNATGTIALTSDLTGYVTLAGTETITGAKTFSDSFLTLAPTSGGGTLNLKQDAFLGATNGYTSLTSSGSDFAIIAATGVGTSKQAVFSLASLGATLRTYTLPDANGTIALAGGGGGGNIALPNFATAQIINASSNPTTYDLTVLFPSINFSNVAVHLDMQFLILGSSSVSSVYYNVVRDAFSSFFSYGSAYTQYDSGSPLFPSFIFGGTNSNPTIEFYISGGDSISVSFTITTL